MRSSNRHWRVNHNGSIATIARQWLPIVRWIKPLALWAVLLLLLVGYRIAFAQGPPPPPNIVQGTSATFPATGGGGYSGLWQVTAPGGSPVANNVTPNGWTVSYTNMFTVGVPGTAPVGNGYGVVYVPSGGGGPAATFNVIAAAGPPASPAIPTGLAAMAGNQSIGLTWTAASGAASYNVYRGIGAGMESASAIATGVTTTSYTDNSAVNGTTYYYTVKSVNTSGTSAASNEAHATPTLAAPAAPTNPTAVAGNGQVALSWSAVTGTGITYQVFRGITAGGESTTALTSTSGLTFLDTTVTNGMVFYYTVKATNTAGSSGASSETSALPLAPPAPFGLAAAAGNASVSLAWSAPTGTGLTYNIYRGPAVSGPFTKVNSSAVSALSYTNSGLTNGVTYFYAVTALSTAGESSYSNVDNATPSSAIDFSVLTDSSSFSVPATGSGSQGMLITPYNTFSGTVTLTVTGLPGGVLAVFSPTSPVAVTAGNATNGSLGFTAGGAPVGVYSVTLTATSGTLVHSYPLTLTITPANGVSQLSLTDISLPLQALIQWQPGTHAYNGFNIMRNNVLVSQTTLSYYSDNTIQLGTTYAYHVIYNWSDPRYWDNNLQQWIYPAGTQDLGTIKVTPEQAFVSDNQVVDARYDPRYSAWTFLDHNFGTAVYRGGLFAGYNADNSQVGHTYLKFPLPALPVGQAVWPVTGVEVYFTRCYTAGTTTVACQSVPSSWSGTTLTWDNAPTLTPAVATSPQCQVSYDGILASPLWVHWQTGAGIVSAFSGGSGAYAAALSGLGEPVVGPNGPSGAAATGWAYFVRKESLINQPASILYAYSK